MDIFFIAAAVSSAIQHGSTKSVDKECTVYTLSTSIVLGINSDKRLFEGNRRGRGTSSLQK